jgi:hypothetical protein
MQPMSAITGSLEIALLIMVIGVIIAVIIGFSVARIVWMHKHPDWPSAAAFKHVYINGGIGTLALLAVIAAIRLGPRAVPELAAIDNLRGWQVIASLIAVILGNAYFNWVVVDKIRRPPQ